MATPHVSGYAAIVIQRLRGTGMYPSPYYVRDKILADATSAVRLRPSTAFATTTKMLRARYDVPTSEQVQPIW
jgi:hypothetical protein